MDSNGQPAPPYTKCVENFSLEHHALHSGKGCATVRADKLVKLVGRRLGALVPFPVGRCKLISVLTLG